MLIAAPQFVSAPWLPLAMIPLKGNICVISVGYYIVAEMELLLSMINEYAHAARSDN
jgi:hypothetical protein